jgi:hypothetical protein
MSAGSEAACRRFPALSADIEALMKRDEEFAILCSDLAAAETALVGVDRLVPELRDERRAECEGWIEALTGEIEAALANANVVPIAPGPRR